MKSLSEAVSYLLSRPSRKARQLRLTKALDELAPRWESLARDPRLVPWLDEPNPTGRTRGAALLEMLNDFDGPNIAITFRLFEDALAKRRPRRGDRVADGRYEAGQLVAKHYEVIDKLGSGGFGEVLLVYSHEPGIHTYQAMKLLRPSVALDAHAIARFNKEAYVLLSMRPHPNVVPTHHVECLPDGGLALLTEFIPPDALGWVSLADHIRSGALSLDQVTRIAIECCAGLQACYADGVRAHRDIKPANILLGMREVARVADFGIAAIRGNSVDADSATMTPSSREAKGLLQTRYGQILGTPHYMAPEQFVDASSCDERSDIYSLGVVLFEMTSAGRLPFEALRAARPGHWRLAHLAAQPPKLDSPLFPIISRCLAEDPLARFASASELAEALARFRTSQGFARIDVAQTDDRGIQAHASRMNRAIGFARTNQHERAIALFEEAVEKFDLCAPDAYARMVDSYKALMQFDKAIACALKIPAASRSASAEAALGYCHAVTQRWEVAVAHYARSVELDPTLLSAWENLGRGYQLLGRHREALAALERSTSLPDAGFIHWSMRAESETILGLTAAGLRSLSQALRFKQQATASQWRVLLSIEDRLVARVPGDAGSKRVLPRQAS